MNIEHKIMRNYPRELLHKFEMTTPYIPREGDIVWVKEKEFRVTSIHHHIKEKIVIINVNEH